MEGLIWLLLQMGLLLAIAAALFTALGWWARGLSKNTAARAPTAEPQTEEPMPSATEPEKDLQAELDAAHIEHARDLREEREKSQQRAETLEQQAAGLRQEIAALKSERDQLTAKVSELEQASASPPPVTSSPEKEAVPESKPAVAKKRTKKAPSPRKTRGQSQDS